MRIYPIPSILLSCHAYLLEEADVVGVIVVGKVNDAFFRVLPYPVQPGHPVSHTSRFGLRLLVLSRHLNCVYKEIRQKLVKCTYRCVDEWKDSVIQIYSSMKTLGVTIGTQLTFESHGLLLHQPFR